MTPWRKRVLVGGAVVLLGGAGLMLRRALETPCEALTREICSASSELACLVADLAEPDQAACQETLEKMAQRDDPALRLAEAIGGAGALIPRYPELTSAAMMLPPGRREAFLTELKRSTPERRDQLIDALAKTGSF